MVLTIENADPNGYWIGQDLEKFTWRFTRYPYSPLFTTPQHFAMKSQKEFAGYSCTAIQTAVELPNFLLVRVGKLWDAREACPLQELMRP